MQHEGRYQQWWQTRSRLKEEETKMQPEKPKIIGVYRELDLIGKEINLRFRLADDGDDDDDDDDGSGDLNPSVVACTEGYCIAIETAIKDKGRPPEKGVYLQVRTVLPPSLKLANEVKVNIRKSK